MRFLVTAIGSMSADFVIRALRGNYPNCVIVGLDTHVRNCIIQANDVDFFYQVTNVSEQEYIPYLLELCQQHEINFVLPLTDPEVDVLAPVKNYFQSAGITICVSDVGIIQLCRNKLLMHDYFSNHLSIQTIPSVFYSEINKLNGSPIIAKPKMGRSSAGILKFKDISQIDIKNIIVDEYVFQPMLVGDVYTVDVVRDRKFNTVSVARKELIRTSNGAGLSVEIEKNDSLLELTKIVADTLNIEGCMNFEFLKSEGTFYLMDINPRFSAGIAFSWLVGYDFVVNQIRVFQDIELLQLPTYNNCFASKYYKEEIFSQ
jgi:carbamoyl-phosphate synthase large subunit